MSATAAPIKVSSQRSLHRAIEQLGHLDVALERSTLARAKANAALVAKHDPAIAELQRAHQEQQDLIRDYVRSNRDAILGDKVRVMTAAGEIAIEKLPAKTEVTNESGAVAWIKSQGRAFAKKYLRVKESPNLDAIKKDGVQVDGVAVVAGREKVIITPITSGSKSAVSL
jgi:phage host-nuclease inhibitor protein Gam